MTEKPRNPLEIVLHYLHNFETMFAHASQAGDVDNASRFMAKVRVLRTLEADMETEYFPLGDKTTIAELREGSVFATEDGVYAVKSEYRLGDGRCQCVLLASGEYARFKDGDATTVYEVVMPANKRDESTQDETR